jgi:hypothetical protein
MDLRTLPQVESKSEADHDPKQSVPKEENLQNVRISKRSVQGRPIMLSKLTAIATKKTAIASTRNNCYMQ